MSAVTRFGKLSYRPDPLDSAKPDPSFTDVLRPRLQVVSTGDVDLRPFTTDTNQYNAGSCAGNATADSVEILNAVEGLPPVQLSRLFVYTLARNFEDEDHDGKSDIDKDNGTYIRLCFEVLEKFGICREDIPTDKGGWPYDLSKLYTLPSLKAMRQATGHRIHSAYKIYETGNDRCDRVLEALRAHRPVVFGTQIDKAFENLSSDTPVGIPMNTIGGHAMIVVGYLSGLGFIVKNSWGPDWGDHGFWIMKPEYLAWDQTGDLWVPTKGSEFR